MPAYLKRINLALLSTEYRYGKRKTGVIKRIFLSLLSAADVFSLFVICLKKYDQGTKLKNSTFIRI
ncbi:MAG: hypothetical protein CVT94_18595 [Bacteroidetes bacterium HGW-Bacteroidetes-11]|jgi:hypothetical protein|nr:MAG: hypothetical protein CVT94_18595 [Bacteroidetes bacterium HGW-Bacteroidetes-11]